MTDVTLHVAPNFTTFQTREGVVGVQQLINDTLAYRPPGYYFSKKFKQGIWDGYIRFERDGEFPSGLLLDVIIALRGEGYTYSLENAVEPLDVGEIPESIQLYHAELPNNELTLRSYQYDSVVSALENRRGIVNVATNGGKCLVKETKLLTIEGWKSIEQIFQENGTPCTAKQAVVEAKDVTLVNRNLELETATHLTFNGVQPVKNLRLVNGMELTGTLNHPVLVSAWGAEEKWVELKDVKAGDFVFTYRSSHRDLQVMEVDYVVDAGERETYDVHLPGTHSFIANGIVNHNTEIACGVMKVLLPRIEPDERIIFFTHSTEIATQSKKRIEERLQEEIGFIGKGEWDERRITVVMIPTLSKHLKEPSKASIRYTKEMTSIKKLIDISSGAVLKKADDNLKTMEKIAEVLMSVEDEKSYDTKAIDMATNIAQESQTSLDVYERVKELKEALRAFEKEKLGVKMEKYLKTRELLDSCRCFIADEAHHSSSTTWYETFMSMENAEFRLGLTGTVEAKEDPVTHARFVGATGDKISEISNDFLIENGYSARPTIYLETIDKPNPVLADGYQEAYTLGIVENKHRNKIIAERVKAKYEAGKTCLIIVTRTLHGELLEKRLTDMGVDCEFIHGSRSTEDRQEALNRTADGRLGVLIATTILDEGVDVSGINCIWMAAAGKSYKQTLQRVGRGLRKKKDGSGLEVYDFIDATNDYLTKHSLTRYDYYEAEKFEIVKL